MKIYEIVEVAPTGTDRSARASEQKRARLEYIELKKFSEEFANEFMKQFNSMGQKSVDMAYQKAATVRDFGITKDDASALGRADRNSKEYRDRMNAFISAMPQKYKKKGQTSYQQTDTPGVSGRSRGGQLGNTNAVKPGAIKRGVDAVKKGYADLSKGVGFNVRKGVELGKSIGRSLLSPGVTTTPQMASLDKNNAKKL